jgi:antibiotic biosynthesis monooxygenase (ABM) superfamily enzyme
MDGEALTVVVTRRVRKGQREDFEAAMGEFIAFAMAFPGHLDIQVLRPGGGAGHDYTVVDRFADVASRRAFTASPEYAAWMARLEVLTEHGPNFEEMGGTAGWFTLPEFPGAAPPPRPKMALVTFLGVYPLTSLLPGFAKGVLPAWHPLALNVVVTGLIVALLTWAVMPFLTRLFRPWLFAGETP